MKNRNTGIAIFCLILAVMVSPAAAVVTAYYEDLTGFNTAAGSPPVIVNFDAVAPGTDISGTALSGITFDKGDMPAPSAPLIVITAADSYTPAGFTWSGPANKLLATSGNNVLSPGGIELAPGQPPNPTVENDDLIMTFAEPVEAAGFDLLYQSKDGASYVGIAVYDKDDNVIYSNGFIPVTAESGSVGGAEFVGFVSDSRNIKKIVIDEFDGNEVNPDANIGFDTLRAPRSDIPVPEFSSFILPAMMIMGLLGTVLFIRRTKEH